MRTLILAAILLAAPAAAQPGSVARPGPVSGDWQGTGLQVDPGGIQSTWTIALSISAEKSLISYPSLACRGELQQISSTPTRIVFREKITEGDCIDDGLISATLENGRIFWFWTRPGLGADASAVLYPSRPIA